ncbi:MAG: trimethylamine methyltransferase family protein [Desulfobacula sp.]|uniref:trimethylamine methyltransferase family protein n=1 Tax=Desulfobacula sp. TaxID=2593537 RepID=UPI0025BFD621|nr:trimethylamine methyltransferase family protein [Desulfobacula sp.]MCD4720621.1 trimethylamine methyltransferase family protein [Desulfobacula sp.]
MYDRMQELSIQNMEKIHDAAMDLLKNTGVSFNEEEALKIFKTNGHRVEGTTVFFEKSDIQKALKTAPRRFTVHARNPEKSVEIGEDDFVFLPGYGAPFVMDMQGNQRQATMEDYDNFCKLIQTSPYINMNGWMMVEPADMPSDTVHLDLNLSNMLLCDKPFMGSPTSRQGALDGIEMAGILWGGKENIMDKTVSVSLINSLSPLQFSDEMAGALIELARHNQACVVASLIMAGGSGPVTLDGVLALQNAEILAGITLAQLVRPGAPVIYGSTSSAMDMKTGALSIGAPELSKNIHLVAQMARFYNLPSRSGGGLTDALCVDAQAGVESALALSTAARSGINFILHSCGILGSYIAMSFEKFLVDEEACGMILNMLKPLALTDDSIDINVIKDVGIGGQYLTHPKTFKLCRTEFFMPTLMSRKNSDAWTKDGKKHIDQVAEDKVAQRLASYEKPDIDPKIEKQLTEYVEKRKNP